MTEELSFQRPTSVDNDQITIVEEVYFQPSGQEIQSVETRTVIDLGSGERSLYSRRTKIQKHSKALKDLILWGQSLGTIVIKNNENVPDPNKTILVEFDGCSDFCLRVECKDSLRISPSDFSKISLRSSGGIVSCTLMVYVVEE